MYGFKQKGLIVQAFKCGPDYLDPTFHSHVTARPSINLDLHLMGEAGIKQAFYSHLEGADVAIIEGVMGLYDGTSDNFDNGSTAHIAKILELPVVLIVDGSGVSTSIAATVLGYISLDKALSLNAIIINKVSSAHHYHLLKMPIENYTDAKVYGFLEKMLEITLKNRHLGLLPASEVQSLDKILATMYQRAVDTIDFKALALNMKSDLGESLISKGDVDNTTLRLAVAKDEAFYFYYTENLEMLEAGGVELLYFSPIHDKVLPADIDGIYIGGGYPELHLLTLSKNRSMKQAILRVSQAGLPIYAECGGLMYLTKSIVDNSGCAYDMVGVFDTTSKMTTRLQHFGYVTVTTKNDSFFGPVGTLLYGHEFHRSSTDLTDITCLYDVKKSYRVNKQWQCGAYQNNTLGAYAHIHFKSAPEALDNWLAFMKVRKTQWQSQL